MLTSRLRHCCDLNQLTSKTSGFLLLFLPQLLVCWAGGGALQAGGYRLKGTQLGGASAPPPGGRQSAHVGQLGGGSRVCAGSRSILGARRRQAVGWLHRGARRWQQQQRPWWLQPAAAAAAAAAAAGISNAAGRV